MNDNRYDELNHTAKYQIGRLIDAIAASDEECVWPSGYNWSSTKEDGARIFMVLEIAAGMIRQKMEIARFPKRAQFRYYKIEEAKKVTA